jgi:hypothetical protein
MPGPRFDDNEWTEQKAQTPPVAPPAEHDDLALELPAWDLLPAAEFVRRRPAGN